ncbi:9648_t:CDS:2, partial [Ambispora leptoticha]
MSSLATTNKQDSTGGDCNINNSQTRLGSVQETAEKFIQQSGKGKERELVVGGGEGNDYDMIMSAASDENRRSRESSSSSNENEREMDESSNDASNTSSSDSSSKKSKISSSTTDAWFQEFNSNVKELNQSFDEDDSETPYSVNPFQKSHPPSQSIISKHHSHAQTNHPHRVASGRDNVSSTRHGAHHAQDNTSAASDSYRSVIDDLTLKNQRLRQKLRKLERLNEKSLHKEKLFEVRYFQMPRHKRQELEEYLKDFAAQLPTPPPSGATSSSNSTSRTSSAPPWVLDNVQVKGSNKAKMKQVVQAIEKVFTTKPLGDDHYLKDQEEADPDGYVYLNLLTNMAQLHTMNVTLPFIKQSIRTFSNCLELSDDGTKVRWRSGIDPSNRARRLRVSSNESGSGSGSGSGDSAENVSAGSETAQNAVTSTQFPQSPSERSSNATSSSSRHTANSNIIAGKSSSSSGSKPSHQDTHTTVGSSNSSSIAHYRPMFPHRNNTSSSSSSSDENNSSGVEQPQEGPIIYYEGGVFCTDLSRVDVDFSDKFPSMSPDSSEMENSTANGSRKESSNVREKRPALRYERGTNIVLGSNPQILADDLAEEETSSGQEADDEDSAQPVLISDDSKTQLKIIEEIDGDDVNGTGNNSSSDNRKKVKTESTLGALSSFTENTGDEDSSNGGSGRVSITPSPSNEDSSRLKIPITQMLATSGASGVVPEDNFTVVVKTSHPWSFNNKSQSPRRHKSFTSPSGMIKEMNINDNDDGSGIVGTNGHSSSKPPHTIRQKNQKNRDLKRQHSVVSTELIRLPPSLAPQITPSPLAVESRRTSYTNLSALGSSENGGSSGYGSSSSSQAFSEMSYDPTYVLKNNTILALSRNRRESSPENEVQDMELDSPSSDSSAHELCINLDAEEEEHDNDENNASEMQSRLRNSQEPTIQAQDGYYHYHKNKIEESQLGVNLRLQEEATKERRKLATVIDNAPEAQSVRHLNNIVAESRALIQTLPNNGEQNKYHDHPHINNSFTFSKNEPPPPETHLNSNPERSETSETIEAMRSLAQKRLQDLMNASAQLKQEASKQNWNALTQSHQQQVNNNSATQIQQSQTQGSSMTINFSVHIQQLQQLQQLQQQGLNTLQQQNWNETMQ